MKIRLILVAAIMFGMVAPFGAEAFEIVGVRSLGMGGANVAAVRDGNASYWNPGMLGFYGEDSEAFKAVDNNDLAEKDWGFGLDAGAHLAVRGRLPEVVDTIGAIDFNGLSNAINANQTFTQQQIADALLLVNEIAKLGPKDAFTGGANGSLDVRVGHVAVAGHLIGGIAVSASADLNNLSFVPKQPKAAQAMAQAFTGNTTLANLPPTQYFTTQQAQSLQASLKAQGLTAAQANAVIAQADQALAANPQAAGQQQLIAQTITTIAQTQAGGSFSNNQSKIAFRGAAVLEVPIAYGYAFLPYLSVGGALKLMQGRVFARDERIFNQKSNNFTSQTATSTQQTLGLDLGVAYRLEHFQAGLLLRNLNTPKFSTQIVDSYTGVTNRTYTVKLKPQLRAGLAWMPLNTVTLAADFDLMANDTFFPGIQSQMASLGFEWDAFRVLALRLGLMKDLKASDLGTMFSAGLGLNLWAARIDIAGMMSTKKAQYQGK
ncbi:hypothetical protein D6833_11500, partial [Candidatus Parcubacteria bacterium]